MLIVVMVVYVFVVDFDDSFDSYFFIFVIDVVESFFLFFLFLFDFNIVKDWNIKYCKFFKKCLFVFCFMMWIVGCFCNVEFMKKKYCDEDVDSELFCVLIMILIGLMLGKWLIEMRMYWVMMGENEEGGGDGGGGEMSGDDDEKKEEKRWMFVMIGGSGSGRSGRVLVYV